MITNRENSAQLVASRNSAEVRRFVSSGASVNEPSGIYGVTPAMLCCIYSRPETLQYLIEHEGANADLADNNGRSPLHYSSVFNSHECSTALIHHGVALDAITTNGETALWWACQRGHLSIVELLVHNGADINRADNAGRTPIDIARQEGQFSVAKYLETECKWRRTRGRRPFASKMFRSFKEWLRNLTSFL
jgi:ankyrin repeat protein